MPFIQAGDLDRQVVLEVNAPTLDAVGQPIAAWSTHDTVWARYRPLRGTERFVGGQEHAELAAEFTIRYRSDLDPATHRLTLDGEVFDIESIAEVPRGQATIITCTAKVDD